MRSLKRARERARRTRAAVGASRENLSARIEKYIFDVHKIELIAVESGFLSGGRAEVVPAEGCLYYDKRLDLDPAEKMVVILHELGHLELHPRLKRRCSAHDPMTGSMYLNDGGPAMARYNRRSREEAEANAFATEFLCPSDEVFGMWLREADQNSNTLAGQFGVPVYIVQAQLAEALYRMTVGDGDGRSTKKEFECDESQEKAARFTGAPVLVSAGPGTGKTATLVRRIEYLLTERDAKADEILVLTFSTDAAEELMERIERRFGANIADEITISTFHGFGVSFLLHHGQFRDVDANAYILDEAGQAELVTEILGKVECGKILNIKRPQDTVEEIVRHISYLKDRLHTPNALNTEIGSYEAKDGDREVSERMRQFLNVFRAYEMKKTEHKRLDFADLIAEPIEILKANNEKVRDGYRERYKWVLVDEYQDVSRSVASLLQLLCGTENPPWVVGDSRQTIYGFRGAARENVDDFEQDFPGAIRFDLTKNYRSCAPVVDAANQLACLMEEPERENAEYLSRWEVASGNPTSVGLTPVSISVADSDQAEYEGVAAQVKSWLEAGVPLENIAVLARRNVDVRDIMLALGRSGVRATTNGLVTPEGAAGDLANIVTFADRPQSSLPRLAFSLGRGWFPSEAINKVIERLLATLDEEGVCSIDGYGEGDALAAEVARASEYLRRERFGSDAFATMCLFLFDGSDYLRRVLREPEGAEKSLALCEIVASLARAAVYRFTHQDVTAFKARKGFGKSFRDALGSSVPCLVPPPSNIEAVRVMTCHASKGLEFGCVVVAGQTLPRAVDDYKWLPPAMQPPAGENLEQENSIFFVGATRAQQALVVAYATTATGTERSKKRTVTPLLKRWHTIHQVHTTTVPPVPIAREQVAMNAVWGGELDGALAARSLDKDECGFHIYLQGFLGARYPVNENPLYPIFHAVVRYAMRRTVETAHERGVPVSPEQARQIFLRAWAESEVADHTHHDIYLRLALRYVEGFAQAYIPSPGEVETLEPIICEEVNGLPVRLDLVTHHRGDDGVSVAILFRPESLAKHKREQGLLWGALNSAQRVPFVLLRMSDPQVRPYVFSGDDGVLYEYLWGKDKDFDKEAARVGEQFNLLGRGMFVAQVDAYKCDKCESRLPCPHWQGAVAGI